MNNIDRVNQIRDVLLAQESNLVDLEPYVIDDAGVNSTVNKEQLTGANALISVFNYWKNAFSDIDSKTMSIEEKDGIVTVNWETSARHTGTDFMGIPANNKPLHYTGETVYEFDHAGMLVAYHSHVDINHILSQIKE